MASYELKMVSSMVSIAFLYFCQSYPRTQLSTAAARLQSAKNRETYRWCAFLDYITLVTRVILMAKLHILRMLEYLHGYGRSLTAERLKRLPRALYSVYNMVPSRLVVSSVCTIATSSETSPKIPNALIFCFSCTRVPSRLKADPGTQIWHTLGLAICRRRSSWARSA